MAECVSGDAAAYARAVTSFFMYAVPMSMRCVLKGRGCADRAEIGMFQSILSVDVGACNGWSTHTGRSTEGCA